MSWNVHYRTETGDILELNWRIDIEEVDYSGSIITMQTTGDPINFNFLTATDNIYENPIKGSSVTFSVYSDTNFQFIDLTAIYDLQYRVSIYINDTTLKWRGFLAPWQYQEPYNAPSYPVSITATDSLGFLKNIPYSDSGVPYNGRQFISKIVLDILNKIQVVTFTEYVNIYETRMANTVDDSPFDQQELDVDLFLGLNCYDTLELVLKSFNAVIRQNLDGTIVIYRPTELVNTTVYGRVFTAFDTKTSTSFNPSRYISRAGALTNLRDVEGGMMIQQSQASEVDIIHDYGNKESWIDNWQFKGDTFIQTGLLQYTISGWSRANNCVVIPISNAIAGETEGIIIGSQNAYPTLDTYIFQPFGFNAVKSTSDVLNIEFDYLLYNVSTTNRIGEYIYIELKSDNADWWLYAVDANVCAWSATYTRLEILSDAPIGITDWVTFKRKIPGLPAS